MSFWDEEWQAERGRTGPVRYVERDRFLNPGAGFGQSSSLYRTRSHGHSPAPNLHIYNYNRNEAEASPSASPPYMRGRSPARSDALLDEVEGLRRDLRRQSRSPAGHREPSPGYYQNWQLEHIQRDASDRLMWEREQNRRRLELQQLRDRIGREEEDSRLKSAEEQMRWKIERERLKGEAKAQRDKIEEEELKEKVIRDKEAADRKAKEERQRAIKDWEQKQEEEEKEKKEAEKRAVEAFERRRRDKAEEEKRVLAEYERKKREQKEEEDNLKLKFKLAEEREKEEEKQREKEYEMKRKQKEDAADKLKKEKEAALDAEMHKRLSKFGFQENQIEAMTDPKKAEKLTVGASPSMALTVSKPTYIKIHKDHLAVETLKYYRIPFEYDSIDRDYIIILQEMSNAETDILFEHTRRLRKPTQLFIEDRGRHNDPQYAWVRKPARSKSRSRSRVRLPALFGPM